RRIEAITGTKAAAVIREHFELVDGLTKLMNNPKDFLGALSKLIEDNSALRKEIEKSMVERALALKTELMDKMELVDTVNYLAAKIDVHSAEGVKTLAYALKAN